MNLDLLAENASRLGARLQETISERTRDLTARTSGSLFLDGGDERPKDLRKQLDTGSDREKLDALKRLIAMISKGRNVSEYFAQVVKNVASSNLEVRKLVYIYLLRYAEQEPDLALLSINTFQKDLNDGNPLIRAMALRVLAGIKVSMIASVVVLAVKKCAADPSPYVRKAAAYAIPKVYELDSSHLPELIEILSTLIRDRSPLSMGATAVAFNRVCPTRLDLLHGHYRRLCRTLLDVDEWGQVNLLELLVRYVRTMIIRPTGEEVQLDDDLQLLLNSAEPLLMSRNPAVVMTVAKAFYNVAHPSGLSKTVSPLLRVLEASKEVERVILTTLLTIAQEHSTLFVSHYNRFLIRSTDSTVVKELKIQMLVTLINQDNHQALLREFIDYAEDVDDVLVARAIRAIGHCATLVPTCTQQCLTALMSFIHAKHEAIVSNAVLVLKYLVQSELRNSSAAISSTGQTPLSIIAKLAYKIDDIHHPYARGCVLWLVGQYAADTNGVSNGATVEGVASWAPDVLRKAAKSFQQEESTAKLQTLTLAAKLLILSPSSQSLILLSRYVFTLARYDLDYDVRDRARMLSALLAGAVPEMRDEDAEEPSGVILRTVQVKKVLFEGKDAQEEIWSKPARFADSSRMALGSLGAVTGKDMDPDHLIPDWLEQGTDSTLRDTHEDRPLEPILTSLGSNTAVPRAVAAGSSHLATPIMLTPTPGSPATKGNWTDLDKFYASESEDEEGSEEEEEEEELKEGEEEAEEGEEGEEEDEDDSDSDEEDENAKLYHSA